MLTDPINNKKIRLLVLWSLVFSFLLAGCSENKKEDRSVTIHWEAGHAESIMIPRELLPGVPADSIEQSLHIQLAGINAPMLGEYMISDDSIVFRPLIAFTRGLKYEVRLYNKLINEFEIPSDGNNDPPEVISIYPSGDTLPLNLLKIHIAFSKPMQEGQSVSNIAVIKKGKDTIPSIFLDLQPELWNKERTTLTLWLDPGRIKRDLQPNRTMGLPLEQGAHYQLVIREGWRDAGGVSLPFTYSKEFVVSVRDSLSPGTERWTVYTPLSKGGEALKIDLHEPLDYVLLKNAIRIADDKGNSIKGVIETMDKETIISFIPSAVWTPGDYTIEIEARLEDLAGNNLNRLFDKDLLQKSTGAQKEIYRIPFHIQ